MTAPETTFPSVETGAYVRHHYGVPAAKGMKVLVDGKRGTIVGFVDAYLQVLLEGHEEPVNAHPTWRVLYIGTPTTEEK